MGKETYYFQHDFTPTQDPKIQALLSEHKAPGYGLFWYLIELLHSDDKHRLPLKQYIYMAIAGQMRMPIEQVKEFIDQCINYYELFKSDGEFFWSERVLRNIDRRLEISNKRSVAGKISAQSRISNSTSVQQVSTGVQQNSTKERKEKKRKEKEIINNTMVMPVINILFNIFWDLYDKKIGKVENIKSQWIKLTEEERTLAIEHIPKYKISQPDKQYRKDPATYLNNKSFNDEIIIRNEQANGNINGKQYTGKQAGFSLAADRFHRDITELVEQ